jgi:hypothetical protein
MILYPAANRISACGNSIESSIHEVIPHERAAEFVSADFRLGRLAGRRSKKPFNAVHFTRWRCWQDYGEVIPDNLIAQKISGPSRGARSEEEEVGPATVRSRGPGGKALSTKIRCSGGTPGLFNAGGLEESNRFCL